MTRYSVKITDSSSDYGHEHEATSKREALQVARNHKGGLYQRSGGTVCVIDREAKQVVWEWHEGAEGGYFRATPTHPYQADPHDLGDVA